MTNLVMQFARLPAPPPGTTITILAPSNEAFATLGSDILDALRDNVPVLQEVLLDHVLLGEASTSAVSEGETFDNLNGRTVTVAGTSPVAFQAPGGGTTGTVQIPDTAACAGLVQVIDTVLILGEGIASIPGAAPTFDGTGGYGDAAGAGDYGDGSAVDDAAMPEVAPGGGYGGGSDVGDAVVPGMAPGSGAWPCSAERAA